MKAEPSQYKAQNKLTKAFGTHVFYIMNWRNPLFKQKRREKHGNNKQSRTNSNNTHRDDSNHTNRNSNNIKP